MHDTTTRRDLLRGAAVWGILIAVVFVTRTALDWFAPPLDFHLRSAVSTFIGIGTLLTVGFWGSTRSGSLLAGSVAGVAASATAAIISLVCVAVLLAIWHDEQTLAAIRWSGGLGEVFELPVLMIVPGAVLGTVGGAVGAAIKTLRAA